MPLEALPDLDELIASGEIETTPEARIHARMRHLWEVADAAFRQDPEYAIEMAQAASDAVRAPAKIVPLSVEEEERRERRLVKRHESYLRRKAAAQAAGDGGEPNL